MELKKLTLLLLLSIFFTSSVFAMSVIRTVPDSVAPGANFQVTYTTEGTSGRFISAIEDTVSGGCTPITKKVFLLSDDGSAQSTQVTYIAPSSGICTFIGTYQFTGQANSAVLASDTITVSSNGGGNGDDGTDEPFPTTYIIIGVVVVIAALVLFKKK
jgi:hypothetical protein